MNLLKEELVKSNYKHVKSYINSGNILLISDENKNILKSNIQKIINTHFGFSVEMIIKTKSEIDEILKKNPYNPNTETDNSKKIVVMLSDKIEISRFDIFKAEGKVTENYYIFDDLLYIYYHDGAGKSKFTNQYIESRLKLISTARNWNTIQKMSEMME